MKWLTNYRMTLSIGIVVLVAGALIRLEDYGQPDSSQVSSKTPAPSEQSLKINPSPPVETQQSPSTSSTPNNPPVVPPNPPITPPVSEPIYPTNPAICKDQPSINTHICRPIYCLDAVNRFSDFCDGCRGIELGQLVCLEEL